MELRRKNNKTKEIGVAFVTDDDAKVLESVGYYHCCKEDFTDDEHDRADVEVWKPRTQESEAQNMSRVDNIAKFAKKRDEELAAKEMSIMRQIEKHKETIRALKPRIDELLTVGNACLTHNIPLEGKAWGGHEGYDTHQFITNGWSHLLGFVKICDQETRKPLPFTKLGIEGGGACNFGLRTDGTTVELCGKETLYVLKKFVDTFDEFETEFYKYVDTVTQSK